MSKMKGGFLAMAAMMTAVAYGDNSDVPLDRNFRPIETDEDKKRRLAQAEIKRNKANGLKEFFYGENSLYALNQKNADKKARSKHWL